LDDIIEKASPDWSLLKITMIDRNILRLGLYELLFGDLTKVPAKVAINEAVDLAKEFGGNKSSRFVNGVVGAVYREIGEPEKTRKQK
jgi:N utilization substance protein B